MELLGTAQTAEGRRSGRLSSLAATGGGTAAEGAETQATVLHSLRVERMVAEQLRAALPPPTLDDDFSESGGEALPGAEYEVDYVEPPAQFDATTATTDDGDDTQQHEGESHEAYEDRLNGMIPPPEYFCCRPVFF